MILKTDTRFAMATGGSPVPALCPGCGHKSSLQPFPGMTDLRIDSQHFSGIRICADAGCRTVLYIVINGNKLAASFPATRISFNRENIPPLILSAFEEAVTCHSQNCHTAAAMMLRKTLELLCEDQGAKGNNLKERVVALGGKVILPQALIDGMDELRLLGNDAAHIDARSFTNVGEAEVRVGIEFSQEMLKAVYQLTSLLAKMKALKVPPKP